MEASSASIFTGYGPGASRSQDRFSTFDGKRENFEIFLLRLKTASMSTGLDSMLHNPREIEEQIQAAKTKLSLLKTRSESTEFQELAQKISTLEHKRAQLTHLILSHLSENVLRLMLQTVPSARHTDPAAIYTFLQTTYGMSDAQKSASENAEDSILRLLQWKWQKGTFIDFVRKIHQRINIIFLHTKMSDRAAKALFLAILLKHVLVQIAGKQQFSAVHQKFALMLLERDLPNVTIFDDFLREVEQLDVILTSVTQAASAGKKDGFYNKKPQHESVVSGGVEQLLRGRFSLPDEEEQALLRQHILDISRANFPTLLEYIDELRRLHSFADPATMPEAILVEATRCVGCNRTAQHIKR